jgi:hypothetical protein
MSTVTNSRWTLDVASVLNATDVDDGRIAGDVTANV